MSRIPDDTERVDIIRKWLEERAASTVLPSRKSALQEVLAFINGLGSHSQIMAEQGRRPRLPLVGGADLVRYDGRTVSVALWYPRVDSPGTCNMVHIELIDVRASRDIQISYDFDRDGFAISAQRDPGIAGPEAGEHDLRYHEVAFVPAWHEEPEG